MAQLITFQANRITFEQPLISAQLSYEQSIRDLLNILAATPADVTNAPAVPDAKPKLSSIRTRRRTSRLNRSRQRSTTFARKPKSAPT